MDSPRSVQGCSTILELLLSSSLTDEEHRHVREHLSEEELTVFDILTRPGPSLAPSEQEVVKKVTKELLAKLKSILVLDWRNKIQARARIHSTIKDTLDNGLPSPYTPEIYNKKVEAGFEHIYERYRGEGSSVFTAHPF